MGPYQIHIMNFGVLYIENGWPIWSQTDFNWQILIRSFIITWSKIIWTRVIRFRINTLVSNFSKIGLKCLSNINSILKFLLLLIFFCPTLNSYELVVRWYNKIVYGINFLSLSFCVCVYKLLFFFLFFKQSFVCITKKNNHFGLMNPEKPEHI